MKKIYALVLLALAFLCTQPVVQALPVDSLRSSAVANSFLLRQVDRFGGLEFAHKHTNSAGIATYYVFNCKKGTGFVIVTADDACYPILGYAKTGSFDKTNVPVQLQKLLFYRTKEIAYVRQQHLGADPAVNQAWRQLEEPATGARTAQANSVNPLLTTTWNQSPYYNDLCPYDAQEKDRAVTGCVATAMAQIMKYHNYPKSGQGIYTYTHDKYGRLSADFGSTTYDWSNMPNRVTGRNTAVATLMYHCGVSVDMGYGVDGSSAYTSKVADALKKYFKYAESVRYVDKKSYTEANWVALLKTELDNRRPIEYKGQGSEGGHAFVCDGYDDNGLFHFNWGWNGSSDGYFRLTALNPGSLGTGGGAGGFNYEQGAIIGIQPPATTGTAFNLQLSKAISVNPSPIGFGTDVTVSFNLVNRSTGTFQGEYAVALFDKDYQFISFIGETVSSGALSAGYTYNSDLTFTQKSLFLSEGDYYVGAYYREPQKEWQILTQPGGSNPVKVQAAGVVDDLKMYGTPMKVGSDLIYQKTPFSVTYNIANFSTTPFEGDLSLDLYDLEGNPVASISTKSNVSLGINKTFSSPLVFSTTGLDVPTGTYLLAPTYKSKSAADFYVLAAYKDNNGTYPNLIRVVVAAPALVADRFESNDREAQASALPLTFSGNQATTTTENSNLHVTSDLDYYKLDLPGGYSYEITARAHDSDNSGNGKTYTTDVLFSYKVGSGTYSDVFDVSVDDNNGKITVPNGGPVVFKVAPFFAGEKGTYLFDVQVTRRQIAQPAIALSSPRNGDTWFMTTTQQITWTDNISENVGIYLLRGSGNTIVQTIAQSAPSSGQYAWTLPDNLAEANDYRIGIISTANNNVQAISNPFTIARIVTANEEDFSGQITAYPNPTTDWLTIEAPGNVKFRSVKLIDLSGRAVLDVDRPAGVNHLTLDVSGQPTGLYILRVENQGKVATKKISVLK